MTATVDTPVQVAITSSISRGYTLNAPETMTSFFRSTRWKEATLVADGEIAGVQPATFERRGGQLGLVAVAGHYHPGAQATSPTSPCGTGVPSSLRISARTPATARPQEASRPGRRTGSCSSLRRLVHMPRHSV